ncbi:hypothetical protein GGD65_002126 [Bradyrhizobium sp. CIR18]|nr:hypothetical protein [Bradyrhizobium sp. CIR18]
MRHAAFSCPGRRAASPAMRSILPFDGALQSRAIHPDHVLSALGPGSAQQRKCVTTRPGHEIGATRSGYLTIFWRCSCCYFSSRNGSLSLPATNRQWF